ncbi:MAG: hypothetical protein ACKO68_03010 [Bacteroidota bacterium]
MIEELTKLLNEDVKAFTHGEADVQRLDHAIKTAQEITEKLIILRYKAYEAGLFSSPEEPSPRQEFDLDLSPMGDEESTTINVEDSVHNQESKATDIPRPRILRTTPSRACRPLRRYSANPKRWKKSLPIPLKHR